MQTLNKFKQKVQQMFLKIETISLKNVFMSTHLVKG